MQGQQPVYVQPNNGGQVQPVYSPQAGTAAPPQWVPPPKPDPNGPPPIVFVVYDNAAVKTFTRNWKVSMCQAPCTKPCTCCYGCWCGPCFAYSQREQILGHPQTPYRCCLSREGPWYCCGCVLPRWCLAVESLCCLPAAVYSNRKWIQMNYNIASSCCDQCLMCCAVSIGCICAMCGCREIGQICANLFRCSVLGCMLTQQQYEMDHIYDGIVLPGQTEAAPAQQKMV